MKSTSSPFQVVSGIILGVALQPLSLILVEAFVTATTKAGTEERGWSVMGAAFLYFAYFGMAQVLTILPASLLVMLTGKQGMVRGLLGTGTFLAIANIAVLILVYLARGTML